MPAMMARMPPRQMPAIRHRLMMSAPAKTLVLGHPFRHVPYAEFISQPTNRRPGRIAAMSRRSGVEEEHAVSHLFVFTGAARAASRSAGRGIPRRSVR